MHTNCEYNVKRNAIMIITMIMRINERNKLKTTTEKNMIHVKCATIYVCIWYTIKAGIFTLHENASIPFHINAWSRTFYSFFHLACWITVLVFSQVFINTFISPFLPFHQWQKCDLCLLPSFTVDVQSACSHALHYVYFVTLLNTQIANMFYMVPLDTLCYWVFCYHCHCVAAAADCS